MKLGIIGCGNMGSAIARGVLSKKVLPFSSIYISDKEPARTKELYRKFGIRVGTSEEVAKKCNFVVIAVKPQDAKKLLSGVAADLDSQKHLISVMAGVTIEKLEAWLGKRIAITRAMPNMAAMAGKSVTCLCHNKAVRQKALVEKIFESIGEIIEIDEKYMDVVTAVSGSGPAYFFYLAEALCEAAIRMGIKKESASRLAATTLAGSGALAEALGLSVEELRARVTSKKGTTDAAMSVLKNKGFKKIIAEAVNAAAARAKELSKGA